MALFSDVDWMVLLAVGAFLLLGPGSGAAVRQLGRYYARLMRFRQEMMGELAKAADLPPPVPGQPLSLRQSLLDLDAPSGPRSGIPIAVTTPPIAVPVAAAAPSALGPATWSTSSPALDVTPGWGA